MREVPTVDDSRRENEHNERDRIDDERVVAGEEAPGRPPLSPYEPPRADAGEPPFEAAPVAPPEDAFPEGGPQPEEDAFAHLNYSPGEGDDTEPPFFVTERDFGESEEPKEPSKAATFVAFAIVVLAVVGILMTAASIKLFTERAGMSAALDASTERLSMVYAGPDASDTSKRRIAWLQNALEEGDFAQAQKALQSLGAPEIERPSPLTTPGAGPRIADGDGEGGGDRRLPRPAEDTNLPLQAQVFFEQHPELWEAFFGFSVTIKRMEQAGVEIEPFMRLRTEIAKAAEMGQPQRVEDLLNQARDQVEAVSADRMPQGLQTRLEEFGEAIQKAQQEHRDVRPAVELAQQSERAARQGDIQRAERLMDQAIAAVRSAPRMTMGPRPGGMPPGHPGQAQAPQMGPEIGLIRFVADLATNVMRSEERDLAQIRESINIAAGAIREKNADQIREILAGAKDAFSDIGDRRREMSAAIQRAQEQVRQARAGGPEASGAAPSEEQQRERQEMVLERVGGILAQVREMPREQFEANQAEIAQAVLQAMTAPVQLPGERPELTPEERTRQKMRLAGEMYRELTAKTDADTAELDETFAKVRQLLTEHDYERAEALVDEGVAMMRALARDAAPAGDESAGRDNAGYGPQLQLDTPTPSLNLRRGLTEPRAPGPSIPADTADPTNEGAEQ